MAIPDYQTLMLPLLNLADDGAEHLFRDAVESLADSYGLSAAERVELLPSGAGSVFANRVGWARSYMKQAGLLKNPKRGVLQITAEGQRVLAERPARIDNNLLGRFESFRAFRARSGKEASESPRSSPIEPSPEQTPEDAMAAAYQKLRKRLEADLLDLIRASPPALFERLVVDLLLAMGYGGSRRDAGQAIGRSGDGGIDGIIKEDRLGLDAIYIQAKRWVDTIGRPEIQKFAGALQGQRATKGVFITTSGYTKDAIQFSRDIQTKIVLIDGDELARLLVDHNVAVAHTGNYEIKRIDTDYFEGE